MLGWKMSMTLDDEGAVWKGKTRLRSRTDRPLQRSKINATNQFRFPRLYFVHADANDPDGAAAR